MSLNMEQPFTTAAIEEQILFGDLVTPSVEESKQQISLQETLPSVNPNLSPELNHVLENILCMDPNDSLVARILVVEQITTIEEFAFLEKEDIDSLNLNRESIKTVPSALVLFQPHGPQTPIGVRYFLHAQRSGLP